MTTPTPDTPTPLYAYDLARHPERLCHGAAMRGIAFDGRAGVNFSGIRGRLAIPDHTLNAARGSMTLWVAALDDIDVAPPHGHHGRSNPQFDKIPFISDREALHEVDVAQFALYFWTWWHPGLIAKWGKGSFLKGAFALEQCASASTSHFHFKARHWYQLALVWDRPASQFKIYANGVLIGANDQFAPALKAEACGPVLYMGNPMLALSSVAFYDDALGPDALRALHAREATRAYPELAAHLHQVWEGGALAPFDWQAGGEWREALRLPLQERGDFHDFFVQGCNEAVSFEGGGMRIRTPDFQASQRLGGIGAVDKFDTSVDLSRIYLWTRRRFEGDLHVSFDFRINAHGGLALLMTQASGMQREDFLDDYALRVNGSMATVFGEDVRNYHWEYYREMCDTRNDLVTHAVMKNPWYRPLAFQVEPRRWECDRWYRLDWLQEGARLRGAIDGVTVIDVCDNPRDNNGAVFNSGRVMLRCMMRTDVTLRNLLIEERPHFTQVLQTHTK